MVARKEEEEVYVVKDQSTVEDEPFKLVIYSLRVAAHSTNAPLWRGLVGVLHRLPDPKKREKIPGFWLFGGDKLHVQRHPSLRGGGSMSFGAHPVMHAPPPFFTLTYQQFS